MPRGTLYHTTMFVLISAIALFGALWLVFTWSRFAQTVRQRRGVPGAAVRSGLLHASGAAFPEGLAIWMLMAPLAWSAPLRSWAPYLWPPPPTLLLLIGAFLLVNITAFLGRAVAFRAIYGDEDEDRGTGAQ